MRQAGVGVVALSTAHSPPSEESAGNEGRVPELRAFINALCIPLKSPRESKSPKGSSSLLRHSRERPYSATIFNGWVCISSSPRCMGTCISSQTKKCPEGGPLRYP